jgi:hypothetical protein
MKVLRLILLILSIVTIMYACYNKQEEISYIKGKLALKAYYPSGKLKEISFLNIDSLKDGISIQYYESGDTAVISRYFNGQKDSIETEFYESGELKSLRSWNKSLLWREYIIYHDGLKFIYYTELDGDTVEIEEPLTKIFSVYNHLNEVLYQREFDEAGKLIEEQGNAIVFVKIENTEAKVNEPFVIQYYLATPRWVEREFHIEKYNSIEELLLSEELPINERYNAAFYQTNFDKPGMYKLTGILKLRDMYFENVKIDTVSVEVLVTDKDGVDM